MNTTRILPRLATLALIAIPAISGAQNSTNGTIHFADGRTVEVITFSRDAATPSPIEIHGKIGAQRVKYNLADLKEIHFNDYMEKSYSFAGGGSYGAITVIGRTGNRTVIEEAYIKTDQNSSGGFSYIHVDPVTDRPTSAGTSVYKTVSHIILGETAGRLKQNPTNKEFFPARYVFDPYTGKRLVWATRE